MADLLPAHCHHWRVHHRPVLRHLEDGRGPGRRLDWDVFPGFPAKLPASHQTLAGFVGRRGIFWTLVAALLIVAAIVYAVVLLYAFPLLARFENTTFGILKTALLVGLRYLVCTLLMAGIYFLMGWVVVNLFTPAFLLGFGCCAMLCSFLLVNIIHAIGGDPDAALAAQDAESKEDGENQHAADE